MQGHDIYHKKFHMKMTYLRSINSHKTDSIVPTLEQSTLDTVNTILEKKPSM